jgi:hypothetical protein
MKGHDYTLCLLCTKLDINTKSKKWVKVGWKENTTF